MEVIWLFVILLFHQLSFAEIKPVQTILVQQLWQADISSPQGIKFCQDKLWSYSVKEQSLYSLDLKAGKIQSVSKSEILVQDLACFRNQLILLSAEKGKQRLLAWTQSVDTFGRPQFKSRLLSRLSLQKFANRLECTELKCFLAAGEIYSSSDLKKWKNEKVPKVTELRNPEDDLQKNPFADWQNKLNLARPSYQDLAIQSSGELLLLDSFHAQFAMQNSQGWSKWGEFGAWEGSFLFPKRMRMVAKGHLVIVDSNLKAIFLYSVAGRYRGTLALEKNFIYTIGNISGLETVKENLYFADFSKNKIIGISFQQSLDKLEDEAQSNLIESLEPLSIKQNLMKNRVSVNEGSANCLNCHDGTLMNHQKIFSAHEENANKHSMSCTACHDQHHRSLHKFALQKSGSQVCIDCHALHANPEVNHTWSVQSGRQSIRKGGACLDCHRMHNAVDKMLAYQPRALCIQCHAGKNQRHREISSILQTDRAKDLHFDQGKIACNTCHLTHRNWRVGSFVRDQDRVRSFCYSCHGQKSDSLYKYYHKSFKAKE